MVAWAAIIPAVASVASSAISSFSGGNSSSSLDYQAQTGLMDYQAKLNRENAYADYLYNTDFMKQQFGYNKWFSQNQYQNTVEDLKKAGLNPLLAISNGSNSAGSVSAGTSHTSSVGLLDPSSMVSAKAQQLQSRLGIVSAINDTVSSLANSVKAYQEGKTEANKRANLDADTALKSLQSARQSIENSNLDSKMKSEILTNLSIKEANLAQARYNNAILPYAIKEKSASAQSMLENARSNSVTANANYINATSGNWQKALLDYIRGLTGNDAQSLGKKSRGFFSGPDYKGSFIGI